MAHRKSFSIIVVSILLLIPFFCEAINKRDTETEDSSSGEAEVPRPRHRVGYGSSPNSEESPVVQEGQDQDTEASPEEGVEQSTSSSVAAIGKESNHLPRESDEENVEQTHETDEESVDLTTLLAAPSSAVPLAPIPSEGEDVVRQDSSSHQPPDQQPPHEDSLGLRPSETVVIWDGTGEPEREHTAAESEAEGQPKQPTSQDDQPTSQPEQPTDLPEQPASKPEQPGNGPMSQGLQGGSNGNGLTKEPASDSADKTIDERKPEDGANAKPVSNSAAGIASSSMTWVVIFAVVSSALLMSGMGDSEAARESSCYLGCRHNFADFNPYAWPPTPANRNGITLRPVT